MGIGVQANPLNPSGFATALVSLPRGAMGVWSVIGVYGVFCHTHFLTYEFVYSQQLHPHLSSSFLRILGLLLDIPTHLDVF